MRHLLSFVLSLILTPLIFVTSGYAQVQWTRSTDPAVTGLDPAFLAMPALFVAGGLYAVLVLVRLSPVGLFLAGVAFFGVGMWALYAPTSLTDALPDKILGVTGVLDAPVNGFGPAFAILGVPLLLTVFSGRRWRRWPNGGPPTELSYPTDGVSAAPEYGAPSYGGYTSSSFSAPSYSGSTYIPPSSYTSDETTRSNLDGPTTPVVPTQATSPEDER